MALDVKLTDSKQSIGIYKLVFGQPQRLNKCPVSRPQDPPRASEDPSKRALWMLPLMLATQTPATSQSSSAEKPAYPLATAVGSVDLRFAADVRQPTYSCCVSLLRKACGARDSVKPGVERSGTPG